MPAVLRHPEPLTNQRDQHRLIPPIAEQVGHGLVGDRLGKEQRAVDLLGPEIVEDTPVGGVHGHELRQERLDPVEALGLAAVDLAEVDGARATVLDVPGPLPVRAEVDERRDDLVRADPGGDAGRVHAVLERDHDGVGPDQRGEDVEGRVGVLRLHGEEGQPERAAQLVAPAGAHRHGEFGGARDPEAVPVDGVDVLGDLVDQEHVLAGLREIGAGQAPDGAGAVDGNGHDGPSCALAVGRQSTMKSLAPTAVDERCGSILSAT